MAILQTIKVPLIAVNDISLTIAAMPFEQGDAVKKRDIVIVFETSKTTYDVEADTDGYIGYSCEMDEEYEVNTIVANIYSDATEVPVKTVGHKTSITSSVKDEFVESVDSWQGEPIFSAAAIQLMQENNLKKDIFKGWDFVNRADVELKLGVSKKSTSSKSAFDKSNDFLPVDTEKVIVEKLSSGKKREIAYLSSVQSTGLTSTINTVIETDGIFVHINESLQYLKNSLLPVIIYEAARLLEKYNALNAYYADGNTAYYKSVNIGFAIDIGKGLKVLKIDNTISKGIKDIEQDIISLSGKYLDDTLTIEDITGISFTITDLSAEGVSFFTPLVNRMNSAILGISSIDEKLNRLILSVTFDHRVMEGKLVAEFLNELKERVSSYRSKNYPSTNQYVHCFKCFKMLKDDLSDVGFTRCITPKGEEGYICQSCLKGF